MKNWNYLYFVIILFLFVLNSPKLFAQTDDGAALNSASTAQDSIVAKNPKGAMLRSMVVPGWGQFYNRKWFKGVIIAGTEVGLVGNAVILNQWAKESVTDDERLYYVDNRNLSFWVLGAVILYSMADAYVDAALFNFDESPELSFNVLSPRERYTGVASKVVRLNLVFRL
jgi:hypothetical protein